MSERLYGNNKLWRRFRAFFVPISKYFIKKIACQLVFIIEMTELSKVRKDLLTVRPEVIGIHNWIYAVLNIWLPNYKVCPEHDAPYTYFKDRYLNHETKTIAWACRSGGKSYFTGLECWLKGRFNPGWEANILGGSKEQSEKSYKATNDFWNATEDIGGMDVLQEPPLISVTRFKNRATYHISTASRKSARGPHQPALFLDEVDEIEIDVFNDAMMQPQTRDGYPASWALASTMHRLGGLMSDWVDNAKPRGYKLYSWCVLEVMEGCYDYNCSTCYLHKWCGGKLKEAMVVAEQDQQGQLQNNKARMGFNTVEDIISKAQNAALEMDNSGRVIKPIDVDADLFCKRPSRTGLVYPEWSDANIINNLEISNDWPRYRTFDFGYTNPWVCLYIAKDPSSDRYYVYKEIYVRSRTTVQMLGMLTDSVRYELNVADISGAGDRATLNDAGIPTVAFQSSIVDGIKLVRHKITPRLDGKPSLFVSGECKNTILELSQKYRYPDDGLSEVPIKENDHAADTLRNFFVALNMGGVRQSKGKY